MYLHLQQLLSPEVIEFININLSKVSFNDGKATASGAAQKVKNNLQLPREHELSARINQLIEAALQNNMTFRDGALPKAVLPFMISMYEQGMQYGMHVDSPLMYAHPVQLRADMSMTIFLNDPSEYEGGELEIEDDKTPKRYKLNAGDAIIYPTTKLHRVKEITKGKRIVAVTWIQSLVRDAAQRESLFQLNTLQGILNSQQQGTEAHLLSQQLHSNMLRMWSDM
jgi:PKHD-type hydroxylase